MPFRRALAACATLIALGTAPAQAVPFDILMTYVPAGINVPGPDGLTRQTTGFTERQVEILGMAERFWETVITGFSGRASSTITVIASMAPVDGRYRTAAYAGPRSAEWVDGLDATTGEATRHMRPRTGAMAFDSDDFGTNFPNAASEQTFLSTAIHEISHVLGFGTLFGANGLVGTTPDRYVGRAAVAAFNRTHATTLPALPLDSRSGHWSECWVRGLDGRACLPADGSGRSGQHDDPEVLTPIIANGTVTISPATIAAFRDLGYLTIDPFSGITLPRVPPLVVAGGPVPSPVPLPAGALLLLTALSGVVAIARGRRR